MTSAAFPPSLLGPGYTILEREPNAHASTFPSEILTCRKSNGAIVRVLSKSTGGCEHNCFGHRAGVAHEAAVYREVLATLDMTAPRYCGDYTDPETGETWLAIEFIEGATSAEAAPDAGYAMELAARWAARFHQVSLRSDFSCLPRYDEPYYAQWAHRTWELAGPWRQRLTWLEPLISKAPGFLASLAAEYSTPIHGEFTPHNVMVRGEEVFPVDWESAAVGLPEIDLVCLTDKWPDEIVRRCERAYAAERFGSELPSDWDRRLDRARLYSDFRWLGDRPEWTVLEKVGPRFENLRGAAERLGLL